MIIIHICLVIFVSIHLTIIDYSPFSSFLYYTSHTKDTIPIYIYFFINLFIYLYLFLAVLGLRFCARAFSSCGERGPLFIAVRGPLTVAASPIAEHRLQMHRLSSCGSWALERRISSCGARA